MSDIENKDNENKPVALDDTKRVKIMSPGMMVYKRFIRNKLAITGLIILVSMFLFSFLGGVLYPYGQSQVFKYTGNVDLDYAVATYNTELRFTEAEGQSFPQAARAQLMLAMTANKSTFESGGVTYVIVSGEEEFYRIGGYVSLAEADVLKGKIAFKSSNSIDMTADLKAAFTEAYNADQESFTFEGVEYQILRKTRSCAIAVYHEFAIASMRVIDGYNQTAEALARSYDFRLAAESALFNDANSFTVNGQNYSLEMLDENNGTIYSADGTPFAEISDIIVNPPADNPIFLSVAYKSDVREAIIQNKPFFTTDTAAGEDTRYDIQRVNTIHYVKTATPTEVINIHESPSWVHPMGTDASGMDMLARLMYGGRISLTVGFVVVLIELFIGVIIGGISGYFSGWIDTLLMRFVDLFNTIPQMPMLIILGSIMDAYRVESMQRVYFLMFILGIMGWTGIARVVRGQILSLREQDFMVAAEASGLSIPRRIFKHLVPNVMPLLIVNATMGLGSIILTEATLSFLGLGVQYPLASWGIISNAANSVTVMTYYPWTWIPAGVLIFLAVLGFNFVGDGLRDAFDPKMKR